MTVALKMSMQQDLKRGKKNRRHAEIKREETQRLYAQAKQLSQKYPHTKPLKKLMWAIATIGEEKCENLASLNLSSFLFYQAVSGQTTKNNSQTLDTNKHRA